MLITKELIFGSQILDLKDHFSASLTGPFLGASLTFVIFNILSPFENSSPKLKERFNSDYFKMNLIGVGRIIQKSPYSMNSQMFCPSYLPESRFALLLCLSKPGERINTQFAKLYLISA